MCPSISAISDRSFRGSVNYCMPMVLNIKEHEQFFKKCVQKMLTTARTICYRSDGRFFNNKARKLYHRGWAGVPMSQESDELECRRAGILMGRSLNVPSAGQSIPER